MMPCVTPHQCPLCLSSTKLLENSDVTLGYLNTTKTTEVLSVIFKTLNQNAKIRANGAVFWILALKFYRFALKFSKFCLSV